MEHELEYLSVAARKVYVDALAQKVRQFLEVLPVGVGQDQLHDVGTPRGDDALRVDFALILAIIVLGSLGNVAAFIVFSKVRTRQSVSFL